MRTMTRKPLKLYLITAIAILNLVYAASASKASSFESCDHLAPHWRDVSGVWVASVGPVILNVDGLKVTGVYNQDTWSLDLRYSDNRKHLFGRWSHRNGLDGPAIFHLDQSGCIKHARWGGTGDAVCDQFDSSACIHNWAFHGRASE